MTKLTAAQKRFLENATLIAALRLAFQKLKEAGVPTYLLNEIAETTSGGTPSRRSESFYGGQIPWIKSGELNDGLITQAEEFITQEGLEKSSAKVFPKGTVVIALYGATVGKMGILGLDAASNQAVCAVTPRSRKINNSFLFWFLRNKRQDFLDDSFGGAQPNISQKVLRETLIPVPSMEMQNKLCTFFEAVEKRQQGERSISLPELPPPLEEQRRIVARIEELAEKIEEARGLRMRAIEESHALITSLHLSLAGSEKVTLRQVLTLDERQEEVIIGNTFPQVGIKGFGGGLFAKESIDATQTTYRTFNKLYHGALVLSQVKGWEGAVAVCPSALVGKYVSPEYRTFSCIPDRAIPEYLAALVLTPWFWNQLKNLTRGMGGRRERTRPEQFLNMDVPMPTFDQQKYAISVFERVNMMQFPRNEALKKMDALLPALLDKAFKGKL